MSLRCGSVDTDAVGGLLLVNEEALFGPTAADALPVVKTSPLLIGNRGLVFVK